MTAQKGHRNVDPFTLAAVDGCRREQAAYGKRAWKNPIAFCGYSRVNKSETLINRVLGSFISVRTAERLSKLANL